jgi:hypothetical protein
MRIFHYHPDTFEFVGIGTADPDPLDPDNWLIPAYATETVPPAALAGKVVTFINGAWALVDVPTVPEPPAPPPPAPWSPNRLLKVVKAGREIALNRLAGIAFAADKGGDPVTVTACLAARQSLLDITKLPAVLAATDDASLTAAIGAGYAAIVGACPANIVSAFAGIQT